MGAIRVHEFISLDSVIDTPSWTFQFGFDPRMGEAIGRITTSSDGILLGRTTYEMFEPTWSRRTAEEDPGAPFFNDTSKYVVSSTLDHGDGVVAGQDALDDGVCTGHPARLTPEAGAEQAGKDGRA